VDEDAGAGWRHWRAIEVERAVELGFGLEARDNSIRGLVGAGSPRYGGYSRCRRSIARL
jgi:hypothetical protein